MIDLSKLAQAVNKVVDLATENKALRDEVAAAKASVETVQVAVDGLAAQLIAAADTTAGAVGLAAVAAAVAAPVEAPVASVNDVPVTAIVAPVDPIAAAIQSAQANAPT